MCLEPRLELGGLGLVLGFALLVLGFALLGLVLVGWRKGLVLEQ